MKQFLPLLALVGPLAGLASAQTTLISQDSFDYPATDVLGGKTGGTGWLFPWWSGNNLDDALISSPGVDAIGEQCITNNQDAGSYRLPDYTNFTQIIDAENRFGIDNTVFWISFWQQKAPGSTDEYGGFSFNEQLVAEKLFVGSPWQSGELGMQPVGGAPVTITGSDPNVLTRVVIRLEHLPGDENIKVWLDPSVPHPDAAQFPPDLDEMVPDFVWNEVRLQSGSNQGGLTGWLFDDLVIETEGGSFPNIGNNYCIGEVNSTGAGAAISAVGVDFAGGQPLSLIASGLPQNQFGFFITGIAPGFVAGPGGSQGNLCIIGQLGRFTAPGQVQNSGVQGLISIDVDTNNMPLNPVVAIQPGETWNFQLWYRDNNPQTTSNFTDAISIFFN